MLTDKSMRTAGQDEIIALAYRSMYASVYGYIAKRIGAISDAEDLVHDTFESLLDPHRVLTEKTLKKYVYSIAHNLVIDWYRRHACSIRAQEYFFTCSPVHSSDTDAKVCVDDMIRLENSVLTSVGDNARRAYMMFVHEGNSVREIASEMNVSERSVENHIYRTRMKVRHTILEAV